MRFLVMVFALWAIALQASGERWISATPADPVIPRGYEINRYYGRLFAQISFPGENFVYEGYLYALVPEGRRATRRNLVIRLVDEDGIRFAEIPADSWLIGQILKTWKKRYVWITHRGDSALRGTLIGIRFRLHQFGEGGGFSIINSQGLYEIMSGQRDYRPRDHYDEDIQIEDRERIWLYPEALKPVRRSRILRPVKRFCRYVANLMLDFITPD